MSAYNPTKIEIINPAFEELRIWGITTTPTPSEIVKALNRLEMFMWEIYGQWNMAIGYNFEANPNANSLTNVAPPYKWMIVTNLATKLIAMFNKQVPQALMNEASQSLSAAIGIHAFETIQMIQPPDRMPMGSGNTFRLPYWQRFMVPATNAPNLPVTNYLMQGERNNYFEPFTDWLRGNTISSFTISADPMLTIVSSAISGTQIIYTLSAPTAPPATQGPGQLVMITVTDNTGRIEIRLIPFEVVSPPDVG